MDYLDDIAKIREKYNCDNNLFTTRKTTIKYAHGVEIYDTDNKKYIDLIASAGSLSVGHTPKEVMDAIKKQCDKYISFSPMYIQNTPLAYLSQKLVEISYGDFEKKVSFGLSGSDANDAMIKCARAFTGRPYIISFIGSYHGNTYGSLSMSGTNTLMKSKIDPLLPGFIHIPFPSYDTEEICDNLINEKIEYHLKYIENIFDNIIPPNEVAAFVVESFQASSGLKIPLPGYYKKLKEICEKHNILFCVDDVLLGVGRTGKWSSIEHHQVQPDLISYGKSIAGGLPMSALVGRKEVLESTLCSSQQFTLSANAISCEAALATINIIENKNILDETKRKGDEALKLLRHNSKDIEVIKSVRGIGLSLAIELDSNKVSEDEVEEIIDKIFSDGIIIGKWKTHVLRIQPPLIIEDSVLKESLLRILNILQNLTFA